MSMRNNTKQNKPLSLLVDIIIVTSSIIIALVILSQHNAAISVTVDHQEERYVRPIDKKTDLIFGNPDADIFIVEYGDLECPYCKDFHPHVKTLLQSDWGVSGKVAWVWRNGFHINSTSVEKAKFLECVRLHAGEESRKKSWEFIEESLFGGVLEKEYPRERYRAIANKLDIPFERVETCRNENEVYDRITESIKDIKELNITETPYLQLISQKDELLFEGAGSLTTSQLESFISNIFRYQQD